MQPFSQIRPHKHHHQTSVGVFRSKTNPDMSLFLWNTGRRILCASVSIRSVGNIAVLIFCPGWNPLRMRKMTIHFCCCLVSWCRRRKLLKFHFYCLSFSFRLHAKKRICFCLLTKISVIFICISAEMRRAFTWDSDFWTKFLERFSFTDDL